MARSDPHRPISPPPATGALAALEDLKRTPGISEGVAQKIYDFYHPAG